MVRDATRPAAPGPAATEVAVSSGGLGGMIMMRIIMVMIITMIFAAVIPTDCYHVRVIIARGPAAAGRSLSPEVGRWAGGLGVG